MKEFNFCDALPSASKLACMQGLCGGARGIDSRYRSAAALALSFRGFRFTFRLVAQGQGCVPVPEGC
jgi:hypothetical protein